MARYIDAEKLETDGWSASRTYQQDATTMVYETKKLTDLPTADVVERKRGKWKLNRDGNWACPFCEFDPYHDNMKGMNYCPNCGAQMDGERREDG